MTSSQELNLILIVRIVSESKRRARKMPKRCIVGGCSNTPSLAEGIALHSINAVPGMTSLGTRLQSLEKPHVQDPFSPTSNYDK